MSTKMVSRMGVGLTLLVFCAGLAGGAVQKPAAVPPSAGKAARAASPDHAGSYFHFMLARRYEELAGIYNRRDYVQRAVSEYKQAIADDPESLFLHIQLGNLYWRVGQSNDGVSEAHYVLKSDPNNLDAHRLLGGIYLHDLGANQGQHDQKQTLEDGISQYEAIVKLAPQDTSSAVLLARLYALDNQPAKSEAAFKQILSTHPDSEEALSYLGKLYLDQENYKEAIAFLEKIPANQGGPAAEAMLGEAYARTGEFEKAAANFQAALTADPANADVRRQYASSLMRAGKLGEARTQFEAVLKAAPNDGQSNLRLAQIAQAQGLFGEASKRLDEASKLLPGDMEVVYQQALLQAASGNNSQAIEILRGLLAKTQSPNGQYTAAQASNRAAFLERLGAIYRSQEDYAQAIAAFRQLAELGPDQALHSEEMVIETLDLEGQRQQALTEADRAVQKYPDHRSLILLRASLLGEQGRIDEAVQELSDLLASHYSGDKARVQLAIVQVYSQAKRYQDAQREVDQVLQQNLEPGDLEFAEFMAGSVYERQKKYGLAEHEFKKVLAVDPLNAAAFNYLGYMLADRGVQLQQSVEYIKKALKLEPDNGAYLDSLGWAYFKMTRYDLALDPLQKAAKLLAGDPTVLDHLGLLYLKLGKKQEAAQQWRRALKSWPRSSDTDFDAAAAAKLQKRLTQLERQLPKEQKM
ncbi:MAG: tetratricopeptide repeat protein [Terriglobia bacterium]